MKFLFKLPSVGTDAAVSHARGNGGKFRWHTSKWLCCARQRNQTLIVFRVFLFLLSVSLLPRYIGTCAHRASLLRISHCGSFYIREHGYWIRPCLYDTFTAAIRRRETTHQTQ